jgi:hypothetical protein
VRPEEFGKLKKLIHLIGSRTRDFPACSIVPQPLRYRVPKFIPAHVTIHFIYFEAYKCAFEPLDMQVAICNPVLELTHHKQTDILFVVRQILTEMKI